MSEDTKRCPVHLSDLDEHAECKWCRVSQGLTPHRKPYVLTADDIEFLRSNKIDPELHEPTDLTTDAGGD